MKEPFVSIIIPTYNGSKCIKKAIESILDQEFLNFEIIVIDDGSTDTTSEIIKELGKRDSRVRYFKNEKNLGFVKSLNRGLKESKGKYIARLDDDDFWSDKKKLLKQVNFLLSNPGYVLVGGGLIKVNEQGKEAVRYLLPESDEDIRKSILVSNCFGHSAVVFLKEAAQIVGGYDEEFGFFADRSLWLKLGTIGKFYNFQEYFVCYLDKELDNETYRARDYQIRRKLILNIKLRARYKNFYPGFYRSLTLCFFSFFYSFLPYKKYFWPVTSKMRTMIFGAPSYKYKEP